MLEVSNWHSRVYHNITQAVIWNRKQIHDIFTIPKAYWMSKYMYCVFFLNGMETTRMKGRMLSAAWLLSNWGKPGLQNSEVETLLNTIFWPMACAWHFHKQNKELKKQRLKGGMLPILMAASHTVIDRCYKQLIFIEILSIFRTCGVNLSMWQYLSYVTV